jgi:hypothetical protein
MIDRSQWLALIALHAVLAVVLLWQRRQDHPGLAVFLVGQWALDGVGFLFYPAAKGGLGLLDGVAGTPAGRCAMVSVANLVWISFWLLFALAAERLARGRTSALARLGTLGVLGVVLAGSVAYCLGWLSRGALRTGLHVVIEPALLVLATALLVQYLVAQFRQGERPDLLALALMLWAASFLLKLIFAVRPDLAFQRHFSLIFHLVSLVAFFAYYAVAKVRRASRAEPA